MIAVRDHLHREFIHPVDAAAANPEVIQCYENGATADMIFRLAVTVAAGKMHVEIMSRIPTARGRENDDRPPRRQRVRQKRRALNVLLLTQANGRGDVDGKLYLLHGSFIPAQAHSPDCCRRHAHGSAGCNALATYRRCRGKWLAAAGGDAVSYG